MLLHKKTKGLTLCGGSPFSFRISWVDFGCGRSLRSFCLLCAVASYRQLRATEGTRRPLPIRC